MYSLGRISEIVEGQLFGDAAVLIKQLIFDTRRVSNGQSALFFAIRTEMGDGHAYLRQAEESGIAAVVVDRQQINLKCAQIVVENTTEALQKLGAYHRSQFNIPVIGITGSNGKTIVKEWLYFLIASFHNIVRNPRSYNSQIGVPLSVWQMNEHHTLGIFEAGISQPDEMIKLQKVIQPNLGVFTHLGDAHGAQFKSMEDKLLEKWKLFETCATVISCYHPLIPKLAKNANQSVLFWGSQPEFAFRTDRIQQLKHGTSLTISYLNQKEELIIPFTDKASIENALTAVCTAWYLGIPIKSIKEKVVHLKAVDMRLQQVQGINGLELILDYYNSDLESTENALSFLNQQNKGLNKIVILSDILQANISDQELYTRLNQLLNENKIDELIAIGPSFTKNQNVISLNAHFFQTVEDFIDRYNWYSFKDATILIKGARKFAFERIADLLKNKVHQTVLEVNMTRLQENINIHKKLLPKNTKVMAMVKAFSYGSGGYQIAKLLEHNKLDYLGVAYVDEGVSLRKAGIHTPILILNTDFSKTYALLDHQLEPAVFSLLSLNELVRQLDGNEINIHLEFDTGMHRLGFPSSEIDEIVHILRQNPNIHVIGVFSHLATADEIDKDSFTRHQIERFKEITYKLEQQLESTFIKHIANTAGVQNFPESCFDMVRLGIGIYGLGTEEQISKELQAVGCFKSFIAQIRTVPAGEGIGYGQHDAVNYDRQIAVIAVGYADGYNRLFSRGQGYFIINHKKAPIVGNVCMDMTMCDVSGIDCSEGDSVIIFGDEPKVEELAQKINTIPYEILTSVSDRVNRVFYQE